MASASNTVPPATPACAPARRDGIIEKVSADQIVLLGDDGVRDTHKLIKFTRSNQSTCINQRPIVSARERVKKGQVIADGQSTDQGEIALGKNVLMAFMTWEGYNYEDAILIPKDGQGRHPDLHSHGGI